jgi:NTE family protein
MHRVMRTCGNWALAALLCMLLSVTVAAPEATEIESVADRPRIGLVLGGGGARGAAHIGVLRELERLRIPIDAIAGTSMGAVVGGLYAAGMSSKELETIVRTLDWADAISDAPHRKDLSFRRKQDDEKYPIDLQVGISGGKLSLPKGLVQGQKLDLLLRELTIGVSHIHDFDDLDIPFRAVASDLETGEKVVMRSGDLAASIRASMSVPGLFAPAVLNGKLLVDGGLVGNLPVDVMQQMGVDIIIAVDVEFPLYSADELQSVLSVSEQVLTILIRRETKRQIELLGDQDFLIQPELGFFGSTNFAAIANTIDPGIQATLAIEKQLREFSVDEPAYAEYLADRRDPRSIDETVDFVRVVHDGRLDTQVLESRLDTEAGDAVNTDTLAADANRLFGMKLYEQVSYQLLEENGASGVEFLAETNGLEPNYLQFGLSLVDNLQGETAFNLSARLTRTGINSLGAELRTDLQLGTDPLFFSEFYQPLNARSRWFVAPRIQFDQSNRNAFVLEDNVARYRVSEAEVGLDLGTEIGTSAEFRVGLFTGRGKADVEVGDPALPKIRYDTGGVMTRIKYDSFDNAWFPRQGVRADLTWILSRPGLGADQSFDTIDTSIAAAWSRGKSSIQFGVTYATNTGADVEVQNYFPLGGFLRLSGLDRGEIGGPHAALVRLVYYRSIGNSAGGLFEVPVYFGASLESGNVWQTRSAMSFDSMQLNGSLFLALDSFLGPVFLAGGFSEEGGKNIYLNIGSVTRRLD